MRIITGKAKGMRLDTLDGLETRPTAERVKEAVFSCIQFDIDNRRVLDLFAGSGQMGLEAISRGARECVFVEKNPEAMAIVKKNAVKTKLFDKSKILNTDYKDYLRGALKKEKFDIVFLDPPYKMKILQELVGQIGEFLLNDNGIIVCESEDEIHYYAEGLTEIKFAKYGKIFITVLKKTAKKEE